MTAEDPRPGTTADESAGERHDAAADQDLEDGRYVYCVVAADADQHGVELDVSGVDGESPYVVVADGVAAVVQSCEGAFESGDVDQLGRWLLQHQGVVDAAGDRFGTPLPFRFDTIVDGGDDAIRTWLSSESTSFDRALARLEGRWEYRVEVTFDRDRLAESVADDPSLAELASRVESAGEGTAYLLERKYETRRSELVSDRLGTHRERLAEQLSTHADAVRSVERSVQLGGLGDDDSSEDDGETVSFSILASDAAAESVGEYLDSVADDVGASVRFTGPWPPYTYAPELLTDDEADHDR